MKVCCWTRETRDILLWLVSKAESHVIGKADVVGQLRYPEARKVLVKNKYEHRETKERRPYTRELRRIL